MVKNDAVIVKTDDDLIKAVQDGLIVRLKRNGKTTLSMRNNRVAFDLTYLSDCLDVNKFRNKVLIMTGETLKTVEKPD